MVNLRKIVDIAEHRLVHIRYYAFLEKNGCK